MAGGDDGKFGSLPLLVGLESSTSTIRSARTVPGSYRPEMNDDELDYRTLQYIQRCSPELPPDQHIHIDERVPFSRSQRNFPQPHCPSNFLYGSCCNRCRCDVEPTEMHGCNTDCHDRNDESVHSRHRDDLTPSPVPTRTRTSSFQHPSTSPPLCASEGR